MGMTPNQHNAYFSNKRKEDEEKKERNKSYFWAQKYRDQKEHEQRMKDQANVCPKCFIIRNSARICVMGCDDQD